MARKGLMRAAVRNNERVFLMALEQARATYNAEVGRLTDELEPRIRAGEFSGSLQDGEGGDREGDGPRYLLLEDHMQRHPWVLRRERFDAAGPVELQVLACSSWPRRSEAASINPETGTRMLGCEVEDGAQCLAHDVLQAAAERGWVKPLTWHGADSWYDLVKRPAGVRAAASPRAGRRAA